MRRKVPASKTTNPCYSLCVALVRPARLVLAVHIISPWALSGLCLNDLSSEMCQLHMSHSSYRTRTGRVRHARLAPSVSSMYRCLGRSRPARSEQRCACDHTVCLRHPERRDLAYVALTASRQRCGVPRSNRASGARGEKRLGRRLLH